MQNGIMNIAGIDISKYQGNEIDTIDKAKDGLSFVICKATEGITYTDPKFSYNWQTIPQKGLVRGAYHFYRTNDAASPQAENFVKALADLKSTDIAPIIDFEEGSIVGDESIESIQNTLLSFMQLVESQLNRKPIIYTDINTGNKYMNSPDFAEYALWIALYTSDAEPRLPNAWQNKSWSFWQKSSNYKIGDVVNDYDVFNGSEADLESFIKTY